MKSLGYILELYNRICRCNIYGIKPHAVSMTELLSYYKINIAG